VRICFDNGEAVGVMYVATYDNLAYLGDAPLEDMVKQIRRAAGKSGTNVEYVLKLASALRELGESDDHVFELEERLRAG
jgi:cation transport protein ChaC